MQIGLISDIHCNQPGLERALELLEDCEEILCAGDILYQYRFSNDVLALLRQRGVHAIVGNHDRVVLYSPAHPLRSSPSIDPLCLDYLATLPNELTIDLGGVRIAMFHGSPWDNAEANTANYIYPNDRRQLQRMTEVDADVIVLGHTHIAFSERVGDKLIVNPGSCGESRDGTNQLSCAVLDSATREVEFHRFRLSS